MRAAGWGRGAQRNFSGAFSTRGPLRTHFRRGNVCICPSKSASLWGEPKYVSGLVGVLFKSSFQQHYFLRKDGKVIQFNSIEHIILSPTKKLKTWLVQKNIHERTWKAYIDFYHQVMFFPFVFGNNKKEKTRIKFVFIFPFIHSFIYHLPSRCKYDAKFYKEPAHWGGGVNTAEFLSTVDDKGASMRHFFSTAKNSGATEKNRLLQERIAMFSESLLCWRFTVFWQLLVKGLLLHLQNPPFTLLDTE